MTMTAQEQQLDASVKASLMRVLAGGLGASTKDGPSDSPSTNGYAHGPGGLFSFPGVDPMVLSNVIGQEGVVSMLPMYRSVFTNPLFDTVTGVYGDTGSEKEEVCDDPPVAGLTKAGTLTSVFGRYERMTRELEINRLGQFVNRGDPNDLRLLNAPMTPGGLFDMPFGRSIQDVVRMEASKAFFELGVSFMRLLGRQLWRGNPVNNSAGGGYKELTGFDLLISAGNKYDAITGTALPSMDSDVKNFGYKNVDGSNGGDIVETITYLYRYLRSNARRMNLDPVTWVIVMREEAFYEISQIWPCSYLTYMCNFNNREDQARLNVDANSQIEMRDSMRNGRYLLIDGQHVPVRFDDGITEETNTTSGSVPNTCFASDIYFIPLTVLGGVPVTYLEYFDQNNSMIQEAMGLNYQAFYRASANGAYLLHAKPPNNWCIQWLVKTEPRLIMKTPYLAGRLNDVVYCPLQHTRESYPDEPYFVNGGKTGTAPPSFYSEWNPPA